MKWSAAIRAFFRVLLQRYPRMTVDQDTGAIYVYLRPGIVAETERFHTDFLFADFDAEENCLGVEILRIR